MSQKPGDGPESETPPSAQDPAATTDGEPERLHTQGATPTAAGEPERVGPLELRRLRKADGRALLIYARVEEPQP